MSGVGREVHCRPAAANQARRESAIALISPKSNSGEQHREPYGEPNRDLSHRSELRQGIPKKKSDSDYQDQRAETAEPASADDFFPIRARFDRFGLGLLDWHGFANGRRLRNRRWNMPPELGGAPDSS